MDKRLLLIIAVIVIGLVIGIGLKYITFKSFPFKYAGQPGNQSGNPGGLSQKSPTKVSDSKTSKNSGNLDSNQSGDKGGKQAGGTGVYKDIQSKVKIAVLYPTYLPQGFKLSKGLADQPDTENPDVSSEGFSISYSRGDSYFKITEGAVFDAGEPANAQKVKVRGKEATLDKYEGEVNVYWTEDGTSYLISASGLAEDEVVKIANGLKEVSN